ncbi:MAG: rhodanese-like domain-containing protein [Pseudomonadales bacterium]
MVSRSYLWAATVAAVVLAIAAGDVVAMDPALEKIQRDIEKRHQNVRHIDADEFSSMNKDNVVVFDVRKEAEYNVSHLDGAIRVDPDIKPADFITQHSDRLEGKTAVFYCSVGRRSSLLASRVIDLVGSKHARESYNLEGGLFHWRNEKRSLMSHGKTTTFIHPYNIYWGRLIKDKEAIRYRSAHPSSPTSAGK